jgi:hypothetical protein
MTKTLCPACLKPLEITNSESAHCSPCEKKFEILFRRDQPVTTTMARSFLQDDGWQVAEMSLSPGQKCSQHPDSEAEYACATCRKPLCKTCTVLQADGSPLCADCDAVRHSIPSVSKTETPQVAEGVMCVNHPGVQAMVQCKICRTAICATCDFIFPGNLHICPKCVIFEGEGLSSKRKKMLIWSYVSAVLASFFLMAFFGAASGMSDGVGMMGALTGLGFLVLAASVTGTGLGFSAIDKRQKNPMVLWIAAVWNLIIVGIYVLLSIIGTFSN